MKKILFRIMDHTGDSTTYYPRDEAQARFAELTRTHMAYDGETFTILNEGRIPEETTEVVFHRKLVAG